MSTLPGLALEEAGPPGDSNPEAAFPGNPFTKRCPKQTRISPKTFEVMINCGLYGDGSPVRLRRQDGKPLGDAPVPYFRNVRPGRPGEGSKNRIPDGFINPKNSSGRFTRVTFSATRGPANLRRAHRMDRVRTYLSRRGRDHRQPAA